MAGESGCLDLPSILLILAVGGVLWLLVGPPNLETVLASIATFLIGRSL